MRNSTDKQKYRLSIEVNQEMRDLIDALTKQTGSSNADILRRSIAVLKVAKDGELRGEHLALIDSDITAGNGSV